MRAVLVVLFLVVPLVETAIVIQVGQAVGWPLTLLALVVASVVGSWLLRREGSRAWLRFRAAMAEGRVPTDEVLHGALVLFGGALLLTPGFASDVLGLALMVPPVRALVAGALKRRIGNRFMVTGVFPGGRPAARRDEVVDVEVISVERDHG